MACRSPGKVSPRGIISSNAAQILSPRPLLARSKAISSGNRARPFPPTHAPPAADRSSIAWGLSRNYRARSCNKSLARRTLLRQCQNMNPPALLALPEPRRRFLTRLSCATALFAAPGAFAEALIRTPEQTEGPFYPDKLPLDTDNDLIIVNDSLTSAVGDITWLSGRILDAKGDPIRNATVEIWQCDNRGVYLHNGSDNKAKRDANFQGFG